MKYLTPIHFHHSGLPVLVLTALCLLSSCASLSRFSSKEQQELKDQIAYLEYQVDSLRRSLSCLQEDAFETQESPAFELTYQEEPFSAYDSLTTEQRLSLYYHQNALSLMADSLSLSQIDSVQWTSNIPDSVYMARLAKMNSIIKLPYNSIVRNYIILYTEKMTTRMPLLLGLAQYYMPLFEEIFDSYGLPIELKALSIIESSLNPRAVSRAQAKGMWQFMYRTARSYNLTINSFVDERLDPVGSTYAAAQYLRDAYNVFGDWTLAIASYNCGTGNVNKAIRRAGGTTDFWSIYPFLPRETRGYVPAFVAALYALKYFPEHNLRPLASPMPDHVDTFLVNKMLHFEQITAFMDISIDEIRDLNPQYTKDIVPGIERPYILRLPYQYSGEFAAYEKEIYAYKDSVYFNPLILNTAASANDTQITHRVKKGETLGGIAMRYGVKVSDLKYWNGKKSDRLNINERLIVYVGSGRSTKTTSGSTKTTSGSTATGNSSGSSSGSSGNGSYVTHVIKKGETLGGIAEKYHTSTAKIKSWNNLKNNTIYANQKLKIYTQGGAPSGSTSGSSSGNSSGNSQYYTVKSGDTLWDISRRVGVSVETLLKLNNMGKNSRINPGQKIRIK